MLTVETAVIAFVDFNSSSCNRKGQSYPVEYYLESVEEYCRPRNDPDHEMIPNPEMTPKLTPK